MCSDHIALFRFCSISLVKKCVLLITPPGNVGSVDYLFVSLMKENWNGVCIVSPHSSQYLWSFKKRWTWDFPGSPVVKTLPSSAVGGGSVPGRGAKIPHASRPKHQNINQKQYCNKFNKNFKIGTHQKKNLKKNKHI